MPRLMMKEPCLEDGRMDIIGRMRLMRKKLSLSKKKERFQPVTEELRSKEVRMKSNTLKGQRFIHAGRLEKQ